MSSLASKKAEQQQAKSWFGFLTETGRARNAKANEEINKINALVSPYSKLNYDSFVESFNFRKTLGEYFTQYTELHPAITHNFSDLVELHNKRESNILQLYTTSNAWVSTLVLNASGKPLHEMLSSYYDVYKSIFSSPFMGNNFLGKVANAPFNIFIQLGKAFNKAAIEELIIKAHGKHTELESEHALAQKTLEETQLIIDEMESLDQNNFTFELAHSYSRFARIFTSFINTSITENTPLSNVAGNIIASYLTDETILQIMDESEIHGLLGDAETTYTHFKNAQKPLTIKFHSLTYQMNFQERLIQMLDSLVRNISVLETPPHTHLERQNKVANIDIQGIDNIEGHTEILTSFQDRIESISHAIQKAEHAFTLWNKYMKFQFLLSNSTLYLSDNLAEFMSTALNLLNQLNSQNFLDARNFINDWDQQFSSDFLNRELDNNETIYNSPRIRNHINEQHSLLMQRINECETSTKTKCSQYKSEIFDLISTWNPKAPQANIYLLNFLQRYQINDSNFQESFDVIKSIILRTPANVFENMNTKDNILYILINKGIIDSEICEHMFLNGIVTHNDLDHMNGTYLHALARLLVEQAPNNELVSEMTGFSFNSPSFDKYIDAMHYLIDNMPTVESPRENFLIELFQHVKASNSVALITQLLTQDKIIQYGTSEESVSKLLHLFIQHSFEVFNSTSVVIQKHYELILEKLCKFSSSQLNYQDHNGETALHMLVRYIPIDQIKDSILNLFNPNIVNNSQETALHVALKYSTPLNFKKLLSVFSNLNFNAIDNEGNSVVSLINEKNSLFIDWMKTYIVGNVYCELTTIIDHYDISDDIQKFNTALGCVPEAGHELILGYIYDPEMDYSVSVSG